MEMKYKHIPVLILKVNEQYGITWHWCCWWVSISNEL